MFRKTITLVRPLRGVALRRSAGESIDGSRPAAAHPAPAAAAKGAPASPPANDGAIQELLASLSQAVGELELRRQESLADMQQGCVELAIAVASQVVHTAVEAGQFNIEGLVKQALDRLHADGPVTVRLHSADLKLLHERTSGLSPPWMNEDTLRLRPDDSLPRGTCRAEDRQYGVLYEIQLQLADIRRHLLESLEDAQIERRQAQPGDRSLRRFPDRRETA